MKSLGPGPRKPVSQLGSALSQPGDPVQVSPSLGCRTGHLNVFTPAGFCPDDTPSSPPCEKPRWCPSHKDILPSSGIPRDSLVGSQLDEGRGSGPHCAFPGGVPGKWGRLGPVEKGHFSLDLCVCVGDSMEGSEQPAAASSYGWCAVGTWLLRALQNVWKTSKHT